jgi:FKBP-type peptidyl-prolyl cis-trans isomerase
MRELFLIALSLLLASGCRRYAVQQPEPAAASASAQHDELLIRANRQLVEKDQQAIRNYIAQAGWQMQTSQSGLWYGIYQHGNGEQAKTNKLAEIAYTLSLLDSIHTLCYSSAQLGAKTFRIGRGSVENGLEEGIRMMRVGDKARFILLPHLAHGLSGDGNCIPRRATLIYDVSLLNLR